MKSVKFMLILLWITGSHGIAGSHAAATNVVASHLTNPDSAAASKIKLVVIADDQKENSLIERELRSLARDLWLPVIKFDNQSTKNLNDMIRLDWEKSWEHEKSSSEIDRYSPSIDNGFILFVGSGKDQETIAERADYFSRYHNIDLLIDMNRTRRPHPVRAKKSLVVVNPDGLDQRVIKVLFFECFPGKLAANNDLKTLAVIGPTASGKTAILNKITQGARVKTINMDPWQTYAKFAIGTGRTDVDSDHHYLYGVFDGTEEMRVVSYLKELRASIDTIVEQGFTPIFEGGSYSMYRLISKIFTPKTFGIRPRNKKAVDEAIQKRIRAIMTSDQLRTEYSLAKKLKMLDSFVWSNRETYDLAKQFLGGHISMEVAITESVKRNIALHTGQIEKLQQIPDVSWHYNDTPKVVETILEAIQRDLPGMK